MAFINPVSDFPTTGLGTLTAPPTPNQIKNRGRA